MPKKAEEKKLSAYKPFIKVKFMRCKIRGVSSLIVHAWSQKALLEILAKQRKHAKGGKEKRDPEKEFQAAKYFDVEGNEAFLASGLKNAMITAISTIDGMTKTSMRQAFFVNGMVDKERVTIEYDKENDGKMREDTVRLGGMSNPADIRFRPEYIKWEANVFVEYNELVVSRDQVINLMGLAGWGVGLHEWRPERDGDHGRFEVVDVEDLDKRPDWDTSTLYLRKEETSVWSAIQAIEEKTGVSGDAAMKAVKKAKDE